MTKDDIERLVDKARADRPKGKWSRDLALRFNIAQEPEEVGTYLNIDSIEFQEGCLYAEVISESGGWDNLDARFVYLPYDSIRAIWVDVETGYGPTYTLIADAAVSKEKPLLRQRRTEEEFGYALVKVLRKHPEGLLANEFDDRNDLRGKSLRDIGRALRELEDAGYIYSITDPQAGKRWFLYPGDGGDA